MEPPAQPGVSPDANLAQTMDRLWSRFLPEMRERVAVLSEAAAAVSNLTAPQREAAHAAAHKLAGVLGTFGLARGTELAQELELHFSLEESPISCSGQSLTSAAAELRAMIENRQPAR